jgi:hypothetical protein
MDEKLKKILENDIIVTLNFCEIMNRKDQIEPLCILMAQSTYLDYDTLAWALKEIQAEIINVRIKK